MNELPHQGDRDLIARTLREISIPEAKDGVHRALPVALDEWDLSFWSYVDEHEGSRLFFCQYRPGVNALICFADHTGIWAANVGAVIGKGKARPGTVDQIAEIAREKGLI